MQTVQTRRLYVEIDDSTQSATVRHHIGDKPAGTLQRRRYLEEGPAWRIYALDGTEIENGFRVSALLKSLDARLD